MDQKMRMAVAVIGLGTMGAPVAGRLVDAGYEVVACDKRAQAVADLVRRGARAAATPDACASADVVLILVADDAQLDEVVTGDHGVLAGLAADHGPLLVVMSTVSAATVRRLDEVARSRGARVIDAPVSGGAIRAREGTLSVMVGSAEEDLARAWPVLQCLGTSLFHCGPVGAGETVKVVNNIICAANAFITAEAYRLASENGLHLSDITPIFEVSTGRNYLSVTPDYAPDHYAELTESRPLFDSTVASMCKDLRLAMDVVERTDGSYPVVEGLAAILRRLGTETFENWLAVGQAPRR
jgi:3-hydroxyisobutyrate dehydrogenase